MFCCSYVEKRASVDRFETGCELAYKLIITDRVEIRRSTLDELFRTLGNRYGLVIDDVDLGALDEGRVSFNQLEDEDGTEPDERQLAAWKAGRETLYLCDYDFHVERVTVSPVTPEDFAGLTIKTH